ncbi:hypothetical protein VMCG_08906 [Cytospora schulzeri]|uniref:Uncharacterized protein n=1 Tax=Cytospora schulzeri TaxID=448051 RepID=A0A423VNM1_9PEZI|nr:hypothetical protein VMCG_08906 [Valsa malicola]
MDDLYDEELDADAAAMAEAMGFTGFGMRNKKRKFNPNADSSVAEEPVVPSFTGANTAPLGRRRPMNLPPPESEGGGGNADEIDLDEEEEGGSNEGWAGRRGGAASGGDGVDGNGPEPQHIDPPRPSAAGVPQQGMEGVEMQARINAIVAGNASPAAGTAANYQKPQYQQPQVGKGPRWQGHIANAAHAAKAAGLPWWEGPWDPKLIDRMIDNPWDRLEKQGGLVSRGTWGRKEDGNTAEVAVPGETGTQAIGVTNEAVAA